MNDPNMRGPELEFDYTKELAWECAARRRTFVQVAVISAIVLVGIGVQFGPLIMWMTEDIWKQRRFDRQEWIRGSGTTENIRGWMTKDLFHKHQFQGMTRSEVEAILGPSEKPSPSRPDEAFVYWCGADRGFGIDSEWVYFKVDDAGKVIEYGLTGD